MTSHTLEQIDVQIIDAGALQTRVRASVPRDAWPATAVAAGRLYGPKSDLAQTVPVRYPLADRGTAESLSAEAVVPEPCYTSDELPLYYELTFEVHDGGRRIASGSMRLEFRPARPPKLL